MSNDTEIHDEIMEHMARAFFACAWADWCDEYGPGTQGNGVDVMDEMPDEVDPSATAAAKDLAEALEKQHGIPLAMIFRRAVALSGSDGDREKTPEMFGHYAAMGAMGHGVSLHDSLGTRAAEFVDVPYMEFSYFDLDPAKYPIPSDEPTATMTVNTAGFYPDCPECKGTGKHIGFREVTDCRSCPKR